MLNKFVFALLVTLYDETVVSAHQLQKKSHLFTILEIVFWL